MPFSRHFFEKGSQESAVAMKGTSRFPLAASECSGVAYAVAQSQNVYCESGSLSCFPSGLCTNLLLVDFISS